MKFKKYMVWIILLILITGCGGGKSSATPKKINAPAFTLPQYGAKGNVKLAERLGQPVVLNFWSTT